MSRDAKQPRGADGPRDAFDIPDYPAVEQSRRVIDGSLDGPAEGSDAGLFDANSDVRAIGNDPFANDPFTDDPYAGERTSEYAGAERRDTGRVLASPILGSGPEINRGSRREPTGRHELLRQAPFAPTAAVPSIKPSMFERILDAVHRWRTPLGLGLAAMITVGVVVVYEQATGGEEVAVGGSNTESRSAFASVTEFDETSEDQSSGEQAVDRDVNSAVDELAEPTESTAADSASPSTSSDPASPTTAATASGRGSTPTTPSTPSSAGDSPTTSPSTTAPSTTPSTSDTSPTTTPSTRPASTASPSTAAPTSSTAPPAPVRTEAETGTLAGGAAVAADQLGFTGTGFVTDLDTTGASVSFAVTSVGGPRPFTIRYSAGPAQGAPQLRTLGVIVNGTRLTSAEMAATPTWDDWTVVSGTLELPAGGATITLEVQAGDSGEVNIDYIEVG